MESRATQGRTRAHGRAHHRATSGATPLDNGRPACSNYVQPAAHINIIAWPPIAATIAQWRGVAAAAMRDLCATARARQALIDRAAAREAACTSRPPCTEEDAQRPAAMRDKGASLGRHSCNKRASSGRPAHVQRAQWRSLWRLRVRKRRAVDVR
ncbi:hypothetical protein F511_45413 [Dorcoceras hygrometricum]|uniref:Uncharacterized protein n=1 Tax=Dorcoceras hygrometricum TaxID=472368 RepID=A0A2Z6ZW34_9LAMI|nr:hypothetical protein F511_45413 [Dorcoceras hygrometricum]